MTMTLGQSILIIITVVMATVTTRVLPFIIFPANKKPPRYVQYLGEVLPSAVIGLLVIYCLKDVSFFSGSYGLPEMISVSCIAAFYLWKKNSLACILLGTIMYMVLVQFVFAA